MRAEERFALLFEPFFTFVEQGIDPRQQLFRGVVGVEDHRNAVGFGHHVNVLCAGDGTENRAVGRAAFTGGESGSAVGELNNNGRFNRCSGFKYAVDRVVSDYVNGRQSKLVFLGNLENLCNVVTENKTGFYDIENFS